MEETGKQAALGADAGRDPVVFSRPTHKYPLMLWIRHCAMRCNGNPCRHVCPVCDNGIGGWHIDTVRTEELPEGEEIKIKND